MTPAIEMQGVSKRFHGHLAVNEVHWKVPAGSLYGLIGANGAGKTTLLRLALGVLRPDRGEISVLGQPLGRENAAMRQRVHYVTSGRPMMSGFRVGEWTRYAGMLYERWDSVRCEKLLTALELDPHRVIGHLSAGQQTSLQLAVAIVARPELLLLDEPTNGLDVVVKRQILQLILDMAADQGTTVVMATHNIEDIERMADHVAILYHGQFLFQDELDTIKQQMHCLQVVLPGEWPEHLATDPRITHIERRGQVAVVTIQGPPDPLVQHFQNAGAVLIEPIAMDLTEVLRAVLEKEGYTRAALRWDAL